MLCEFVDGKAIITRLVAVYFVSHCYRRLEKFFLSHRGFRTPTFLFAVMSEH